MSVSKQETRHPSVIAAAIRLNAEQALSSADLGGSAVFYLNRIIELTEEVESSVLNLELEASARLMRGEK